MSTPRYLVNFDPKSLPHRFTDVLIIGGGLAGLRAALEVAPELRVIVVTKDWLRESNSTYAQGGIAGVFGPDDKIEWHIRDTLKAGGTLCHRDTVEWVVQQAPDRIRELMALGTQFDRKEGADELTLGREGGHSHNRILHAMGDATGAEIMRAIILRVREAENIEVIEEGFTLDFLTSDDCCRGAIVYVKDEQMMVWAKQTILCTGGAGQVYRETTNPAVATGDGHAMAYRAGVELRDMEFMQFHPTVLYIAGSSRSLITEAVRGEGAYLRDIFGNRFMADYDDRLELAPRDVVSQAIVTQMEKTKSSNVFLDLSHLDANYVNHRFPGIKSICLEFGLDIASDSIPVRPGAHYMVGGVTVDLQGKTSLDGLWAAGEVTSSGLHGANRLASNSLLEGLVFGISAGKGASQAALAMPGRFQVHSIDHEHVPSASRGLILEDIGNSLKSLMWRSVGVRRDGESLLAAEAIVAGWEKYVLAELFGHPGGWELQNMLTLSAVMIRAALFREETRGVHLRTDFPATDDEHWCRHVTFVGDRIELREKEESR